MQNTQTPPQNIEAEQAVLGAILINNESVNEVANILKADDFYREGHGIIYEGMLHLYNMNQPIDILTLSRYMEEHKKNRIFENTGGQMYLTSIIEAICTSAGIRYHAEIVKDSSIRRKMIIAASSMYEACFQPWKMTDEILEYSEQKIYDIADIRIDDFESFKDVVVTSISDIEKAAEKNDLITGIETGFHALDRMTAGFQPSDLIIIAARPSMGKTAFALKIGYNIAKKNKGVAIFSLEMSKKSLGMRLLSIDSRIGMSKLRIGMLKQNEWPRLKASTERLGDLPIFIDDSSGLTVLEMKTKLRRLMKKHSVDIVIVDYLQLMEAKGQRKNESRQVEVSEISRALKALGKDLNIPVIALSQLNRNLENRENKTPQLSDLRESGSIEQDADVILLISRAGHDNKSQTINDVAEIIVAKHRNGPTGPFNLTFLKEYAGFENYTSESM